MVWLLSRQLRILVISHMYPNLVNPQSGIFVHNQCRALQAADVDIEVISPVPSFPFYPKWNGYRDLPAQKIEDGIPISYVSTRMYPGGIGFSTYGRHYAYALTSKIKEVRKRFAFDVVHCHTLFPDGNAGALLKDQLQVPLVTTAHGSDVMLYPKRSSRVKKKTIQAIKQSDAVITVSKRLEQEVRELVSDASVTTIYNGFAPELFFPRDKVEARHMLGLDVTQKNLLFVGNLYPVKGLSYLLQAFNLLLDKAPNVHLHIVGDGRLRNSLEKEVANMNIDEQVTFHGRQPYEAIPTWLQSADAVVLSSLSEGLPSILLESMGCGVPMISTDVGGIKEILQDQRTGLLVPPENAEALAQAMVRMMVDQEDQRDLYGKAARNASYSYTWRQNAENHLELYETVMNQVVVKSR